MRGLGTLGQAMSLGVQAPQILRQRGARRWLIGKTNRSPGWVMGVQVAFQSHFFPLAVYKLLPLKLTEYLSHKAPVIQGQIAFNFVDGMIRLALFLGFLLLLSRAKDIRRVFEFP